MNYTCIVFLTEYPCKNTLTGITDFFIKCLGQVNLIKRRAGDSHGNSTCQTDSKVVCFVDRLFLCKYKYYFSRNPNFPKAKTIFGPLFSVYIFTLVWIRYRASTEKNLTSSIKLSDQVENGNVRENLPVRIQLWTENIRLLLWVFSIGPASLKIHPYRLLYVWFSFWDDHDSIWSQIT